uniref:Uncharacterized protein n=1 Tax=Anguilla anguilla TaxID=7936 RepID=A0A0E9VMM8_ANGAN
MPPLNQHQHQLMPSSTNTSMPSPPPRILPS